MKTKFTFIVLALILSVSTVFAQSTARIQVIHNSADNAADSVDIYLNGSILLDNFAFRNATEFIDAPAETSINIGVAPKTSTSVDDTIYNMQTTLTANETYILVASGIVSGSGYNPSTAFDIDVYGMGQEQAAQSGNTDLLVYHGSTDAPTVDVYEATGPANLVDNIAYSEFSSGYLELPTADYYLQVRDETGSANLFAYDAPLSTLGLDDAAAVVVASGFADPSVNSDGPGFGLYVALPSGGEMVALPESDARVQVIHNSADLAADTVDVYLNGDLLIDNFAFRNASPFIDAPANTQISIDVAPGTSSSSSESIYNLTTTLEPDETYVLVASGIVSGSGYNPSTAFDIDVYGMGQEQAAQSGNTDLLVYHGSTDAPTVDVYEATGPANLVDNIAYSEFSSGYLELPTADYYLQVRDETGSANLFAYDAPLSTLGLDDAAAVVVASGFADPSVNSDGPGFGLYVALPSGGEMVALPESDARVQVIHNSADLAAETVDVYLNDEMLIDDFAFRTASPFIDAPANTEISIDVAPGTSSSSSESIYNLTTTLEPDETYVLVASGIVSGSGYNPATPFEIDVFAMGREMSMNSDETDVLVYHGSTDAPTVDVTEPNAGLQLVDDLSYGEFKTDYLELATADYSLQIQDETGYTAVAQFSAPLSTLGLTDSALVVVASGFLDPSSNNDGPAFGLYAALPSGGELVELPSETTSKAMVQVIHNSADAAASSVDIYKNDQILLDDFAFRTASPFVEVTAGVNFDISVQPSSSTDTVDALAKYTYNLKADMNYELIASGLVS